MDTTLNTYETTFIVNASLDDSQVESVVGRVQDTITKNGGSVSALNKWGRKRLAYTINKKTNGFYVNIEFQAPGTLLAQLERMFQLDEMILRHLTIGLDAKALAARAASIAAAKAAETPAPAAAAQGTAPVREPLFTETPGEKK